MIVYGDPQYNTLLDRLTKRLLNVLDVVAGATQGTASFSTDMARELLIGGGQCEQAIEDAAETLSPTVPEFRMAARRATDAAASIFLCARSSQWEQIARLSSQCRAALELLRASGRDVPINVKVPEGYAFYLLYPEQYILAVEQWLAAQSTDFVGDGVVVGLRSIGTSLSAIIAERLRQSGRVGNVRRITVRPHGSPFARMVTLPHDFPGTVPGPGDWALAVDEGPGLSGSSLAAAYSALTAAGFAADRVALLTGHGGLPGGEGDESVRRIWQSAHRYAPPLAELRWDGLTLQESLSAVSAKLAEYLPPPVSIDGVLYDLGGGAWRAFSYPKVRNADWPPTAPAFERPKFLWRPSGADHGGLVWTYVGMSEVLRPDGSLFSREQAAARRIDHLAGAGFTEAVCASELGFIATSWIDGARLRAEDASVDSAIVSLLASYCAAASLPALSDEEARAGWRRLQEMLRWNVKEAISDQAMERADSLAVAAKTNAEALAARVPAYGDGRMAPHEWVRRSDGTMLKTDCTGHEFDHTIVGRQPIWWELAGASVEWRLSAVLRGTLWQEAQEQMGIKQERRIVEISELGRFYRAAYAAFRIALLTAGASSLDNREESNRRERALGQYRTELVSALEL